MTEMRTGRFDIGAGKPVVGELRIAGSDSSLVLRDDAPIPAVPGKRISITGQLYDNTKVTLVDCIQTGMQTKTAIDQGVKSNSVTYFPHFVVEGRSHLQPDEATIKSVAFRFKDATKVFYDFDAFGGIFDASSLIKPLTEFNANLYKRAIRTGPEPLIAYFAGRSTIVEAQTSLGTVAVRHRPSIPMGGPKGVRLDNRIFTTITPPSLLTFNAALDSILCILRFVTIAAGRRQTLRHFEIETYEGKAAQYLGVTWSHHPSRHRSKSGQRRNDLLPRDLPFDPIGRTEEFTRVFNAWLNSDPERWEARARVDDAFARQNSYSHDRCVGAGNAFDLLPASAVPKKIELSEDVASARDTCREMFRALPNSDEREALLRAVGRLGHSTLK